MENIKKQVIIIIALSIILGLFNIIQGSIYFGITLIIINLFTIYKLFK